MKKLDWYSTAKWVIAHTPFGNYNIMVSPEGGFEMETYFGVFNKHKFKTLSEAKTYARKDWEERLKQCL